MGKRYVSWVKLLGTFVEFVDGGISRWSYLPFQFYLFIVDFFSFFLRNDGGKGVSGRAGGRLVLYFCIFELYMRLVVVLLPCVEY